MDNFIWDEQKNTKLKRERGISFEDVIEAISCGGLKNVDYSPSKSNHSDQFSYYVLVNNYIYVVPYRITSDDKIVLITIYPSRKHNKIYN